MAAETGKNNHAGHKGTRGKMKRGEKNMFNELINCTELLEEKFAGWQITKGFNQYAQLVKYCMRNSQGRRLLKALTSMPSWQNL